MGNVPFRMPSISSSDFSLGFPPLRCRTLATWSQVAPLVHHQSVTPGRLETSLLKKWPYKKRKICISWFIRIHHYFSWTLLFYLKQMGAHLWKHQPEILRYGQHKEKNRWTYRPNTIECKRTNCSVHSTDTHTHASEPHNLRFPFPFFCFPTWLFRKLDRIMQSYTTSYVHNHDTIYSITI